MQNCISFSSTKPRCISSRVEGKTTIPKAGEWIHAHRVRACTRSLFYCLSSQSAELGLHSQGKRVEESLGNFTCSEEKTKYYSHHIRDFPQNYSVRSLYTRDRHYPSSMYSQLLFSFFVPSHISEQITKNYYTSKGNI